MTTPERLAAAETALLGVSLGDAYGQCFFTERTAAPEEPAPDRLPPPPWPYTDDTVMSLAVVAVLSGSGAIDSDALAREFADRYAREPDRGYGGTAHRILRAIGAGVPWAEASADVFGGLGSMGNGAAMRAAPVGAYFADDLAEAVRQAERSAVVTHAHPEGVTGAIAVAAAAAHATRCRLENVKVSSGELFATVVAACPDGDVRSGLDRASRIPPERPVTTVAAMLGNGDRLTAPDTVPFALWCAATRLTRFTEAVETCVRGGGDLDTTSAIAGGIVASAVGADRLPAEWIARREPLPTERAEPPMRGAGP